MRPVSRIARAQYRQGGGLPYAAQLLLADSPGKLMRGQYTLWQADLAVENAAAKSRRAEAALATDEANAAAQWQALEKRNSELAEMKRTIQAKLEKARRALQEQADASVAAGSCRGAVQLDQSETGSTRAWVAPVETRTSSLSASAGAASAG